MAAACELENRKSDVLGEISASRIIFVGLNFKNVGSSFKNVGSRFENVGSFREISPRFSIQNGDFSLILGLNSPFSAKNGRVEGKKSRFRGLPFFR